MTIPSSDTHRSISFTPRTYRAVMKLSPEEREMLSISKAIGDAFGAAVCEMFSECILNGDTTNRVGDSCYE